MLLLVFQGWQVFGTVRKQSDADALEAEFRGRLLQHRSSTMAVGFGSPDVAKAIGHGMLQAILLDVTDDASVARGVDEVNCGPCSRGIDCIAMADRVRAMIVHSAVPASESLSAEAFWPNKLLAHALHGCCALRFPPPWQRLD
jgi:NAD(P)-dependent dehydrogenase (short-subunit alcohol dehydrogenase family)